jgi:hypothetical protein
MIEIRCRISIGEWYQLRYEILLIHNSDRNSAVRSHRGEECVCPVAFANPRTPKGVYVTELPTTLRKPLIGSEELCKAKAGV